MTGWRTINLLLYPVFLCQFFRTRSLFDNASVREAGGGGIKSFAPFDGVGFSVLPMVFREELGMVALTLPLQTWQIVFTVIIIGLLSEIVRKGIDMLKIFYGDMKSSVYNTSVYFKHAYEDKWITDPVAKEMIKDIDKSEVLDSGVIDSPVLGKIPPVQLSGGVKTLILIKNEPEKVFNASNCGDNCAHWLLKLAKDKDITVNMYHIMDFGNEPFEIEILNNHMVVHDMDELVLTAGQYV